MAESWRIEAGRDLARVHRNLGRMGDSRNLKRRFAREVRAEVRPVVAQVKAAYLANPSKDQPNPPGRGDLRRLLARATTMQVKTAGRDAGVTIRVDGRKMPERMGSIPAMYEGNKRWRHPVRGNRNRWVTQDPTPTFDRIVRRAAPGVRRRVSKVAEAVAHDVTKG